MIRKNSASNQIPKRSTSMAATLGRPVIEQRYHERAVSPTASFTSSILAKGMSERMTPQKSYHQSHMHLAEESIQDSVQKSNRRRIIDFSRRRTVAGSTDSIQNSTNNNNSNNNHINTNKENFPIHNRQQIYRFSPTTSANLTPKQYYFYPKSLVKNEDMLMNSYGLALLQQQTPIQKRQSLSSMAMTSKALDNSSAHSIQKQQRHRSSIYVTQQQYTSDSLDDLLCDREVESYFYPHRQKSPSILPQLIYINAESSPNYYQATPPYIHGTLC